jgi:hypothetical protein
MLARRTISVRVKVCLGVIGKEARTGTARTASHSILCACLLRHLLVNNLSRCVNLNLTS